MVQRQDRGQQPSSGPAVRAAGSGGPQQFRYRAFISYSHEDQAWADWLIKALETFRVPSRLVGTRTPYGIIPRRLTPIFRDRDELASASDLGDKIREALADSASLIVICSPASANSHWVNEEIKVYQQLGHDNRILCLIVDGVPNATDLPGQTYKECFAPALRHALRSDGDSGDRHIEPVAADVRDGMGDKATARLQLIAGMIGVGLDVLKRRDQQRRMRHMASITALALGVMLVTTTLAITAIIARHAAEAARQAAVRKQKQAEGLVNFMLGDLNDKLREVNRLDIMQSVDDRAMAYFESLSVSDVTDQSLALRAAALQRIGEVRREQGHLNKALKAFQLALDINAQRLKRAPGNASRLADYGNSQTYVGFAYYFLGNMTKAEQCFRDSVAAFTRSLAIRPNDPDTQLNLGVGYNNLGQVLVSRHKLEQALAAFSRQIVIFRDLIARNPGNVDYLKKMGNTEGSMAALELERGNLLSSISHELERKRTLSEIVARNAGDRDAAELLMVSEAVLADKLHMAGRHDLAMAHIDRAIGIVTSLVKFDPGHADWRALLAFYQGWQASWRNESQPGSASARQALAHARDTLRRLLDATPDNALLRRKLAMTQNALAQAELDANDPSQAASEANAVRKTLARLLAKQPVNPKDTALACEAELVLGQARPQDRGQHLERALERIEPLARTSDNPTYLALWARALLASGRTDAAQPALRTLRNMGYRAPALTRALARLHLPYAPDPAIESRLDALLTSRPGPAADAGSDQPRAHDTAGS